jgi:5-methyltetrahydropteroyltriglutamate--homocysteine methyltransferase
MTRPFGAATVLGYPRIGPNRELKRALEAYWSGRLRRDELLAVGATLRADTWRRLAARGLTSLPGNTFSHYDHVLDTAILVDAVPDRYRTAAEDPLDVMFAMARGTNAVPPLPMTKWFDTNYHHLVPEIGPRTRFRLVPDKPLGEVREAAALGFTTRPVLVGPVTFLLLSRSAEARFGGADQASKFAPLTRLPDLLEPYGELLLRLAAEGVDWVQFDEPALVQDRGADELAAVAAAYDALGAITERPAILVAAPFGDLGEALPVLAASPVEGLGLDLVRGGMPQPDAVRGKVIVAGVVSGRDVWSTDLGAALGTLRALPGEVVVSTSCSLLHVPYDLDAEPDLEPDLRARLAFADQKVSEVVQLAELLASGTDVATADARRATPATAPTTETAPTTAAQRPPYPVRAAAQADVLRLPTLPLTTIGSFPQTGQLRSARARAVAGEIDADEYDKVIEAEIEAVIRLQERLGLDVLVHGEPERNDMVQYFAEHLDGFAVTRHGWVQSYGSRCTRPPILHGDVTRPAPITVRWADYAQSLTPRPVKGMITGPVTIVAWSFVRRDTPLRTLVDQVATAMHGEVLDLEAAGIGIIQVDEPALRELLPLRRAQQDEYLSWAVAAYRKTTTPRHDATQIHTHVCYSDAGSVLAAIDALDADVTTIECARSGGGLLDQPALAELGRGLGPGVYDIHSPRVPTAAEVGPLLRRALDVVPSDRLWVNPDCGLKTRTYEQVEAALGNLVTATRELRHELAVTPSSR